ncbi:MAG: hypothetical protein ACKOWD_15880 [Rhodoferax sp.]
MNEVRILCVQIVRTEDLAVWQKLVMVGVFCESLTRALNAGQSAHIAEICETARALITTGHALELCDPIVAQPDIQALTFNLLRRFGKTIHLRPTHKKVFSAIEKGLSTDAKKGELVEESLIARYQEGMSLLPVALKTVPALLDNYLLNEMLRESFPFAADSSSPQEHFLRLVARFGLLRFMLAVQCRAEHPLPDEAALVSTVQVFARRFQHDQEFAQKVDDCFTRTGWHHLDKIFKLLKP